MLRSDRRGFLQAGMLGAGGLALPQLLRNAAGAENQPLPRDTSVIILWMRGGPSQLDLWDMKPEAPAEIRGEFQPIDTVVPGIQISELLPQCAKVMDKFSLIRSMHYRPEEGLTDHSSGDQVCFTGYPSPIDPAVNAFPSCGSIVKKQLQHLDPSLPAYVMIPRNDPGTAAGYLGAPFEPFETMADPASDGPFSVPNLQLSDGLSLNRITSRQELVRDLDRLKREVDQSGRMEALDGFHREALQMLTGTAARKAFDLDEEPRSLRERYGFYQPYRSRVRAGGDAPNWPQRMILARRLVEAGVRLVTVDLRWWDTHEDNFWALETGFAPRFDQAYSALIEDLEQRGLLEKTMVIAWGEMGRTPRINSAAGRDHWPQVFSMAIAGGGVQGGRVIGSSDQHAAVPKDNPKIVQDVLCTAYRHLGVDTTVQYTDHAGRPHPVLPCGNPVLELF